MTRTAWLERFKRLNNDKIFLTILIAVEIVLWLPRGRGPIDLRWDASTYYMLGAALYEGKGYCLLNEPGEIHAIQYPPLLPFIVSLHQWWCGGADPVMVGIALSYTYMAISIALPISVYFLARFYLPKLFSFAVALITIMNIYVIFISNVLFAEIPFCFFTVLFLLTLRIPNKILRAALSALLIACSFLIRSAGIALIGAWCCESLIRREWKTLAFRLLIGLIVYGSWQTYVESVQQSEEYRHPAYPYQREAYQFRNVTYTDNIKLLDPFAPELGKIDSVKLLGRLTTNLGTVGTMLGTCVVSPVGYWIWLAEAVTGWSGQIVLHENLLRVVYAFFSLVVSLSCFNLLRHKQYVFFLYVLFSIVLMCLTPWPSQFERYLSPLTPVIALAFVLMAVDLKIYVEKTMAGRLNVLVGFFWIVLFCFIGLINTYSIYKTFNLYLRKIQYSLNGETYTQKHLYYSTQWLRYDEAVDWLKKNAEPEAIVAATEPQWIYLHTNLKSVLPPLGEPVDRAQTLLDTVPVQYAVIDSFDHLNLSRAYLLPVVTAFSDRWKLVFDIDNGHTSIYRRITSN